MIFMACLFSWFLFFGVNPDNQREGDRLGEAAFNYFLATLTGACFSMFTFCFHVQLAAQQH